MNCSQRQYGDEIQCSCGLTWGVGEEDPHLHLHAEPEGTPSTVVMGVDPAAPGADKSVVATISRQGLLNQVKDL